MIRPYNPFTGRHSAIALILCAGSLLTLLSSGAGAATYYIRPTGNDANAGTTPETAWRTIDRVNRASFAPGDRILFESGKTFAGNLRFDSDDSGTAAQPITVGVSGMGSATIQAGKGCGIRVHNTGGFHITNLNVVGSGRESHTESGILLLNELGDGAKREYIRIDHVEARGFGQYGIGIGGGKGKSGFRDVIITHVVAHDNALAGIYVYGDYDPTSTRYAHERVYIGYALAYDNPGIAGPERDNTGSGIVLSDVDGGGIEKSIAHDNGRLCNSNQGGPVGLWCWDANAITIQFCESYSNHVAGGMDGGGFDLDGGTTNSIMQYNYSHDNDGAGYLLAQFGGARRFADNVVRYNISQNDGRRNSYAGIQFWNDKSNKTPVGAIQVYNNTVFVSPAPTGNPSAVRFMSPSTNFVLCNNIFVAAGGVRLFDVAAGQKGMRLLGNAYYASGDPLRFDWEGKSYTDYASWRSATGMETLDGRDTGKAVDPLLQAPGAGKTLNDVERLPLLSAYRLQSVSPLIGLGIDLRQTVGIQRGPRDFFGTRLTPQSVFTAGAHEPQG